MATTTTNWNKTNSAASSRVSDPHYLPVDKALKPDWILFVLTLLLVSFGVVLVYDASYPLAASVGYTGHDPMYFLKRQAGFAVLGLVVLGVMSKVPYWKLARIANVGIATTFLMLIAVHFVGHGAQGAERWIGYGPVRIQPSEFAKVFLVLYLARILALRPRLARQPFGEGLWPLILVPLAVTIAVEREPDLGTAIATFLTVLLLLFAGGVRKRFVAALLALAFVGGVGLALHKGTDSYRWKRILTYLHPDSDVQNSGWQVRRGMIALGTGGPLGLGLGESREKFPGNLPAQRNDFIFAILGEEFGFVGTVGTLVLIFALVGRGFHIAARSKDPFGALLATGITGIIAVQAFENIAVVTGVIPATGIPLPFLSYGGSSLVATLGSIGILLNISQHPFRRDPREVARQMRQAADNQDVPSVPKSSAHPTPPNRRHGIIVGPEVRN